MISRQNPCFERKAWSKWTYENKRIILTDQASILGAADIYVSDFGELKIVPNRFQRDRTAILCQTSMASVDSYRPMQTTELAKTGDSEKRLLLDDCTLKVCNEEAFGLVADLLTV